jgi:hypothetical protein
MTLLPSSKPQTVKHAPAATSAMKILSLAAIEDVTI